MDQDDKVRPVDQNNNILTQKIQFNSDMNLKLSDEIPTYESKTSNFYDNRTQSSAAIQSNRVALKFNASNQPYSLSKYPQISKSIMIIS